jgi:uncharacterized membrane protein YjjB (DUF3815 family)
MPEPRKWSTWEVLVFTGLISFGFVASVAFPPLMIFYSLGCIAWLIYWFSTKDRK